MLYKPGVISRYIFRCAIKRLLDSDPVTRALLLTDMIKDAGSNKYWLDDIAQYRLAQISKALPSPAWLIEPRCAREHNHNQAKQYFNTEDNAIIENWHGLMIRATNLSELTTSLGIDGKCVVIEKDVTDTRLSHAVGQYIVKLRELAVLLNTTPANLLQYVEREIKGLGGLLVADMLILKANAGIVFIRNTREHEHSEPECV